MKRLAPVFTLLLLLPSVATVVAASPVANYRFERPLVPAGTGPNRLEVDVPLLAGVADKGLADLRFFDAAGREVPYLVIPPSRPGPQWRAGRLLPILATKTESGFEIELPESGAGGAHGAGGTGDRLRLAGLPAPYLKRFRLEGSGDRSHWTLLVPAGTLFDLPEEGLGRTDIDFAAGDYRYLRLTWNDASSARLPLPGKAEVRLVQALAASPTTRLAVACERRPSEPGKSRFRLRLPGRRLPIVAIELAVDGGALLRPATVTEGRLDATTGQIAPQRLGGSTLRRTVRGELAAADLRIPLEAPVGSELELTVEDGDNPPLALTAVSAVFAPLPWIYFEAADSSPVTARFGDRSTREPVPPRYDLEAVRETLLKARLSPGIARWGEAREARPAAAVAGPGYEAPGAPGAPVEADRFRYRRSIPAAPAAPAAPPSLAALAVDAEVLAHSPGLADLRIADASGRQVPYVLERRDEPLEMRLAAPLRHAESGDRPNVSRYRIELPYPGLPAARLVLSTAARIFERSLRLVAADPLPGRTDGGEREERTVAAATWRHADPEGAAPELTLDLPMLATLPITRFDLLVEEGDNAPLPLAPPRLLLPAYRLRFFYPAGGPTGKSAAGLTLLYGQAGLAAPRYDLSLLAPRLLEETAGEIALGAPVGRTTADPAALGGKVFWGALIGAVVVLLVLLGRLLRQGAPPEEPPAAA